MSNSPVCMWTGVHALKHLEYSTVDLHEFKDELIVWCLWTGAQGIVTPCAL